MTGKERIEAALSKDGTPDIPAVVCYEDIFIRDHWQQLCACPWWYEQSPDLSHQVQWRREFVSRVGLDWLYLPGFYSAEEREALSIEVRPDGVYRVDGRTGHADKLVPPRVGGEHISTYPLHTARTPDEVDAVVPLIMSTGVEEGHGDLAAEVRKEFGDQLYLIRHASSPLECCGSGLWGFEEMMLNVATRPDLVEHACRRFLDCSVEDVRRAAQLGADGIFVEDCLTDMISPQAFARLNVPFARQLVDEIRHLGLKSIYYFCGNPAGKWDLLLSIGADALSLEESKKGFTIDVADVVDRVGGRCAVLGNLDAVGVLQNGSEAALRAEIARQIAAGRRNGSRFIMSIGSPVTPGTPVERVRLYRDLVHELGSG